MKMTLKTDGNKRTEVIVYSINDLCMGCIVLRMDCLLKREMNRHSK